MNGFITTTIVSLAGMLALSGVDTEPRVTGASTCVTKGLAPESPDARLPLHFAINRGQTAPDVKFLSHGRGYGLFLTDTGAVLRLSGPTAPATVRFTFAGANRHPRVSGVDELPGKANYLFGRDPRAWRTNIPLYAKVAYRDIYPDIDLVYYGNQHQLEYDLIVAPGGDPRAIGLRVEGVERLDLDTSGNLVLHTANGEIRQHKPFIYQQAGTAREQVEGHYVVRGTHPVSFEVGFELGPYDKTRPLVIDPVLAYSSYLGGEGSDRAEGIAVDATGSVYMTGSAQNDFPTVNAFQPSSGGSTDAWVAKVNAEGSALVYSTYVGGGDSDAGMSIALDVTGQAYVTGNTASADFPIMNAAQPTFGGNRDAFVARLSAAGDALIYSTYLGGGGFDDGNAIAVDPAGHAYVTGETESEDFPTANPFQATLGGTGDAFVTKLSADGAALLYSTHLGGTAIEFGFQETGFGIAVNAAGEAYVTGTTGSADFPVVNAFQSSFGGGSSDAFVTKFDRTGASLLSSTYLGGNGSELGLDITLDSSARAIVAGSTGSDNFPTMNALQPANAGFLDGFVTKFNRSGLGLVFSTYLGGGESDVVTALALDHAQNMHVTGTTNSGDFPVLNPIQPNFSNVVDAFVAKINGNGSRLVFSTYLGGLRVDTGSDIAVDRAGSVYVTGSTQSLNFPVAHALQPALGPDFDGFFTKITDFDLCSQDDHRGHSLQLNSATGGYQLSGCRAGGAVTVLGQGRVTQFGNFVLLQDRGVFALYNRGFNAAIATIAVLGNGLFVIADSDTTDNTCRCE